MNHDWRIMPGDCRDSLATLEPGSVQTVVTSPPYFGLRDYGTADWDGGDPDCDHKQGRPGAGRADGIVDERAQRNRDGVGSMGGDCRQCGARRVDRQLGLEPTPDEFVAALVEVFRAVRRVLRDDGTVWLNLGDSYAGGNSGMLAPAQSGGMRNKVDRVQAASSAPRSRPPVPGYKSKDLVGIPWMVAFALRADGWYLRSDIIWAKPNPMPESVTDRPTKSHEYVFLLSKGPRYFYDADAIREADGGIPSGNGFAGRQGGARTTALDGGTGSTERFAVGAGRNRRSVWTVATQPYPGAHFATFPPKLIEPCILAGTSPTACGVCGAPWTRVTERATMREVLGDKMLTGGKGAATERPGDSRRGRTMSNSNSHDGSHAPEVRTVGWEPSCTHQDDTGSSIVLDPFSGAGTTGIVALRHNRSYIGCELSPEYVKLSRWRIVDDAPLLNSVSEAA